MLYVFDFPNFFQTYIADLKHPDNTDKIEIWNAFFLNGVDFRQKNAEKKVV